MARGGGVKADHLGTWSLSIALASVALWAHWLVYTRELRWLLPNAILTSERFLFAGLGLALLVGSLVTAYQAKLLVRGDVAAEDRPHHAR